LIKAQALTNPAVIAPSADIDEDTIFEE